MSNAPLPDASTPQPKADLLIRAHLIRTQQPNGPTYKALAVHGDRITALSPSPSGLDHLLGPSTQLLTCPDATVLPSLDDTHTHLIFAGRSAFDVPVHRAPDIPSMLSLLAERVRTTAPGEWILTTPNWQDFNLRERRFPTLQELDAVAPLHPVAVKRGGHSVAANSLALARAGITEDTLSPEGGVIGRHPDGRLNGLLQDHACFLLERVVPALGRERAVDGLEAASRDYAATGTGCVRDCMVSVPAFETLVEARVRKRLHVRVRALMSAVGLASVAEVEGLLGEMEPLRERWGEDPWLRIWGVKFMLDGGIEAGATEEEYAVAPEGECCGAGEYRGTITWDPEVLLEAMDRVVSRGWRIGTHAYGDRAVRTLLDVYEKLQARHPDLPHATLVMEHGALATPESRVRAIRMGIPTTIQHPLLHDVAGVQGKYWGEERVARMYPARSWLDEGGEIAGGSDFPVGAFAAMRSIWGMASRETVVGVRGPEHAISIAEALDLHTVRAAGLLNESETRGQLEVGRFADLTVWPVDPLAVKDVQELRDLVPVVTIVGGQIQHSTL